MRRSGQLASADQRYVMLSYCWSEQPLMLRLRDALRAAGIGVWMDIEKMAGSLLTCMSTAIEQAECRLF